VLSKGSLLFPRAPSKCSASSPIPFFTSHPRGCQTKNHPQTQGSPAALARTARVPRPASRAPRPAPCAPALLGRVPPRVGLPVSRPGRGLGGITAPPTCVSSGAAAFAAWAGRSLPAPRCGGDARSRPAAEAALGTGAERREPPAPARPGGEDCRSFASARCSSAFGS
jgi:hypothetical protein